MVDNWRAPDLTIGILGASHIAPLAMIDPARRLGVRVSAIASRRPGQAAEYARLHGIETAHDSYDALLADSSVDVIYNSLPPSEHSRWSIAAMRAGKDVLCEKPIAMNAGQAEAMTRVSQQTGRRLIEAFHDRYHPLSTEITRLRTSGRLGTIVSAHALFSVRMPYEAGAIRHVPELGGGALMDLGCYPVHWLRSFTGEEPTVVDARAQLNESGADESIEAQLIFPSGVTASISCTFNGGEPSSKLEIIGTAGSAVIDNLVFPSRGHSIAISIDGSTWTSTVGGGETFDYQLAAALDAITHGSPALTEGDDPIRNMAVIDAVYAAAGMDRSWIDTDTATEETR